jgi:hypothetical protein
VRSPGQDYHIRLKRSGSELSSHYGSELSSHYEWRSGSRVLPTRLENLDGPGLLIAMPINQAYFQSSI